MPGRRKKEMVWLGGPTFSFWRELAPFSGAIVKKSSNFVKLKYEELSIQAGRHVAGGLAGRAAPAVRAESALPRQEPGRAAGLLRLPGPQSPERQRLSRVDSRSRTGRQLLLVPGLRHQYAGDLQAH